MALTINQDQFTQLCPTVAKTQVAGIVDQFNECIGRFDLSTWRRVRYFIVQAAHESEMFTRFQENLMYTTPERLVAVWGNRFSMKQGGPLLYAPDYVRQPEKLANAAYANRFGNRDAASGDGYKYRGRGWFHVTFADNYRDYGKAAYGDPSKFLVNPDLLMTLPDAALSAGWFWQSRGLNALADADQFTKVTGIINGSTVTAPTRLVLLNKANQIFKG